MFNPSFLVQILRSGLIFGFLLFHTLKSFYRLILKWTDKKLCFEIFGKCFGNSRMTLHFENTKMKWFDILICFSALFHLGRVAKFYLNSGRISLPVKFIRVVYLLFVRKQWFTKLCSSSTLNNGRECLIGTWLYTATILTYNYYPNGEHSAVLSHCRKEAAFTHLGEEVEDRAQHLELVLLLLLHQTGQSSYSWSAHVLACTTVFVAFC